MGDFQVATRGGFWVAIRAIQTYQLDELLGTKVRALYQRKKGRDLFDLGWHLPAWLFNRSG